MQLDLVSEDGEVRLLHEDARIVAAEHVDRAALVEAKHRGPPRPPGRSHRRVGPQVERFGWGRTLAPHVTARPRQAVGARGGVRRGGRLNSARAEAPRKARGASAEATRERQNTSRPKVPCIWAEHKVIAVALGPLELR